jgi:hypothetical protein
VESSAPSALLVIPPGLILPHRLCAATQCASAVGCWSESANFVPSLRNSGKLRLSSHHSRAACAQPSEPPLVPRLRGKCRCGRAPLRRQTSPTQLGGLGKLEQARVFNMYIARSGRAEARLGPGSADVRRAVAQHEVDGLALEPPLELRVAPAAGVFGPF